MISFVTLPKERNSGLLMAFFVGWWLSMKKEDSFFKRLQPVEMLPTILDRKNKFARVEETANKTLGFVLVR